jgi:serine/threonine protein kinase
MAASKPKSRSVNDIFEIDSQQIGEGAFGVVYRGKNKLTGQSVALKTFKKGSQGEPISQTVYREISVRNSRRDPCYLLLKILICPRKGPTVVHELTSTLLMNLSFYASSTTRILSNSRTFL